MVSLDNQAHISDTNQYAQTHFGYIFDVAFLDFKRY